MGMRKFGIPVITAVILAFILLLGPGDVFSHGYYCDEINYDRALDDINGIIDLQYSDYEMKFSPIDRHFAGFEINLLNQPYGNTGLLILTVIDKNGKEIERISVDLHKVSEGQWYKTYADASLKKGEVYRLLFSAVDCDVVPYLQTIDPDYLGDESLSGDVLLGYAYAQSTFTFQEKVLIIALILAVWGYVCAGLLANDVQKRVSRNAAVFIFLSVVLTWNYMYNSMDVENESFPAFQHDSESAVTSMIKAGEDNAGLRESENGYGLAMAYFNMLGRFGFDEKFVSDGEWDEGYSDTEPAVLIAANDYTRELAVDGHYIMFSNGDSFRITGVNEDDEYLKVTLDADRVLNPGKYGDLSEASFLDVDKNELNRGLLLAYGSQYGLQGKVFRRLARYMDYSDDTVPNLYLLCSVAAAAVFLIIVFIIAIKYNKVMAGVFYVTFWLSPWIVNYARNLYWVEFTWFLPMAVGLFCSWKINSRACRMSSYILAFIAIAGKCLCGYEYISTVMLGLISFLLVDLAAAAVKKDREKLRLVFRTIFILGLAALAGFVSALYIHASLRGQGDILTGIRQIYEDVILRRTVGADYNIFGESYWASFNASVWETVCKYFHFSTEIITGLPGNLFPLLCLIPLCIFFYRHKMGTTDVELIVGYVVFFLTSVSWFCLAKSHSAAHTHMNYVLWYFGYVQICLYVIVNEVVRALRGLKHSKED